MADYTWVYGAWRSQSTRTAQRDMLALHLAEIETKRDALSASGANLSASYASLEEKLNRLEPKFEDLDTKVRDAGGPMCVVRLRKK